MKRSEIKNILKSVKRANLQIQTYSEEIQRLNSIATKCTPVYSQVPGGGGFSNDKLPNAVEKIIAAEKELLQAAADYADLHRQAHALINLVESPEHKTLLNKRYMNFEKWEKIADDMAYSLQHIFYLHGQALDMLVKATKEKDKEKDKSK